MPDLPSVKVLVTGASGYLGLHCVKQLLDAGYSVRGTVRSVSNAQKVKPVKDLDKLGRLELVEADLNQPESWPAAIKGITYILHVASPYPDVGTVDDSIITTAVDGVVNVFKAAAANDSTVKRIVLTSSCAAIFQGHKYDENKVFTENDWTDVTSKEVTSYDKSKTLAEKAAWDFVQENNGHRFELAVINPCFVTGPMLSNIEGTSALTVKRFLNKEMRAVPRLNFPFVDVRDVAKAHVLAMTNTDAAGHRHILAAQPSYWMTEMAGDMAAEFNPLGYSVSTQRAPKFVLCIASVFMENVRGLLPYVDQIKTVDTTRLRTVLGMTNMITPKQSVIEMGHSLIEHGIIKKTPQYREPRTIIHF